MPNRQTQSFPNAVLRWKLDDVRLPMINSGSAGSTMNLTLSGNNGIGIIPGQRSILKRGVWFPGPDGTATDRQVYRTVNPTSTSHIVTGSIITVSCWAMMRTQNNPAMLVQKTYDSNLANYDSAKTGQSWALQAANSIGNIQWTLIAGPAGSGTRFATSNATNGAMIPGLWYYIAGTYDGAKLRLYVNGSEISNSTATGNIDNSTTNSNLGGCYAVGGHVTTNSSVDNQQFNGMIEDVVVEYAVVPEDILRERYLRGIGLFENTLMLEGPQGDPGADGAAGATGPQGPAGTGVGVNVNNQSSALPNIPYATLNASTGLIASDSAGIANFSINNNIVATVSGTNFSGPVIATGGLTGSLQQTVGGLSYLVAGTNITVSSQSNGQVIVSAPNVVATVTGTWRDPGNTFVTTGSVSIDTSNRTATTLGTDVFFFVSGTVGLQQGVSGRKAALFGGSVRSSGSITAELGLSGSLTTLANGTSYLVASGGISIISSSNGQVFVLNTGDVNVQNAGTPLANNPYPTLNFVGGGSAVDAGGGVVTVTIPAAGSSAQWVDGNAKIYTTSSVSIDASSRYANQIGTDVFFFVSGSIGVPSGNSNRHIAVIGGDSYFSGSALFSTGLTGSLQQTAGGLSYLVAGSSVTITTQSNGQIVIASTATGGGASGAIASASVGVGYHDLTYGPIGLWQLSGTLRDETSYGMHLTCSAGLTSYSTVSPTLQGMMFNGSTMLVTTATLPVLPYLTVASGAMTVEMLVNVEPSSAQQALVFISGLVGDVNGSENNLFGIQVNTAGTIDVGWEFNNGSNANYDTRNAIPFNELCHLVVTRDASAVCAVYVNGTLLDSASTGLTMPNTGTTAASSARLTIGAAPGSSFSTPSNPVTNTSITSLKWIPRVLTADEVNLEYQKTLGKIYTIGGLLVTGTWRDASSSYVTTGSVSIDTGNRTVSQIGSDVFFFVSGSQGITGSSANNPNRHVSVFGGDVVVSGTISYPQQVVISGMSKWVTTGNLPTAVNEGMPFVVGNVLYIVGGSTGSTGGNVSTQVLACSGSDGWGNFTVYTGSLSQPWRRGAPAIIGDKAYIFGGAGLTTLTGSKAIFSASLTNLTGPNAWALANGTGLAAVTMNASCAIIGDFIYLFGGEGTTNGTAITTIQRAPLTDPVNSWSSVGDLPTAKSRAACAVIDDYVYLFGGLDSTTTADTAQRAPVTDPTSFLSAKAGNGSSTTILPAARRAASQPSHAIALVGDKIVWAGGHDSGGAVVQTLYYSYISDPLNWYDAGSILPAAHSPQGVWIVNNQLVIFGGADGSGTTIKTAKCSTLLSATLIQGLQPNSASTAVITKAGSISALTSYQRLFGQPPWLTNNSDKIF